METELDFCIDIWTVCITAKFFEFVLQICLERSCFYLRQIQQQMAKTH